MNTATAVQCTIKRYNMIQYNTAQHNTIQHNIRRAFYRSKLVCGSEDLVYCWQQYLTPSMYVDTDTDSMQYFYIYHNTSELQGDRQD